MRCGINISKILLLNITLIAKYAINFHRTQKCSKNIVLKQKHKKRPTLSRHSLRTAEKYVRGKNPHGSKERRNSARKK